MLTSRRILITVLAVLVLVVLGLCGLVAGSSTRQAAATCNGGSPIVVSRYSGGTLVAQEAVTYPGTTCNGDWSYSGAVLDPITDGSCAYAYYLEPLTYLAAQGTSCTTGAWSVYTYNDSIGSNSVFVSVRTAYQSDSWTTSSGY